MSEKITRNGVVYETWVDAHGATIEEARFPVVALAATNMSPADQEVVTIAGTITDYDGALRSDLSISLVLEVASGGEFPLELVNGAGMVDVAFAFAGAHTVQRSRGPAFVKPLTLTVAGSNLARPGRATIATFRPQNNAWAIKRDPTDATDALDGILARFRAGTMTAADERAVIIAIAQRLNIF